MGGAFLTLLVGAASIAAATQGETFWYERVLWAGVVLACVLFLIAGLVCLANLATRHLRAIRIRNDWHCTYWTKEQQIKVTVWFEDRLRSARYRAECSAQAGDQLVRLNDDVQLGGTYMGRHELISGHSGPVMAEFHKYDVALAAPRRATIRVSIQPRDPWGATKKEAKTIPVQIIRHGNGEASRQTPAPSTEER